VSCCLSAECRPRAAREYSGQVMGLGARSPVTKPKDASVLAVKQPSVYAPLDAGPRKPCIQQLRGGQDSVLPAGDPSQFTLRWSGY
jgi:hypothetical protein